MSRSRALLLTFIVTLASTLRVSGVRWGLPESHHHFSYHPDEYNVLRSLAAMKPAELDFNPHYFHNPAFYYYVCGVIQLGQEALGLTPPLRASDFHTHPERVAHFYLTGRILSIGCGIATAGLVAWLAARHFGLGAGLLAGVLVALSPAHIVLSQYMDVDAMLGLWAAVVIALTMPVILHGSSRAMAAAAAATGFATATKYNGVLLVLPCLVAAALSPHRRGRLLLLIAGLVPTCFILGAPYTVLDSAGFLSGLRYVMQERVEGRWSSLGHGFLFPLTHTWPWLFGDLGPALVLAGVAMAVKRRAVEIAPPLILAVGTYVSVAATGADYVRYSVLLLPSVAVIASFALTAAQTRLNRGLIAALALLAIATQGLRASALLDLQRSVDVRDAASRWLEQRLPRGTRLLVPREPYYFSPARVFTDYFYAGRSPAWRTPSPHFEVVSADWRVAALDDPRVGAVIVSEQELLYPTAPGAATASFLTALWSSGRYREAARFDQPARFGRLHLEGDLPPPGWKYDVGVAAEIRDRRLPHDLKYLNPAILIFLPSTAAQ